MLRKSGKAKFNFKTAKRRRPGWLVPAIIVLLFVGGVLTLRHWYTNNLRPVSSSHQIVYFTVSSGESKTQIAEDLQAAHLIRSAKALENYMRSNEVDILQAGTYRFSQSMSSQQIVHAMVIGDVAKNLLTILPGKRLDQIEDAFAAAGYSKSEIKKAFSVGTYAGNPALAGLPAGASLEGFLYPDSFEKEAGTPATAIVEESLSEMRAHLSNDVIGGFGAQGLSVYQGVTLASIVQQESGNPTDELTIAQVFLSRLKQHMALQSNVTANYAADIAGVPRDIGIESSYNTYLHKGLPPGPISNVGASALYAVAHPSHTTYLYFLAGDDGKVHFSYTADQHEQAIQKYCQKACSQP